MFVSDDGTVTGSIDNSKLDEVQPKTDEAKAQLDALKAERDAGAEQNAREAERVAEAAARQNPQLQPANQQNTGGQNADQKRQDNNVDATQAEDVTRLQSEAEAAGVTVDKRWGADRLRQEIDQAKASQSRKKS